MKPDPVALFLLVALLLRMAYGLAKSFTTVEPGRLPVLALTGSYGNGFCIHLLSC